MINKNDSDSSKTVKSEKMPKNVSWQSDWHINRIFWGLLLVLIGGLALASNFGAITVEWSNLWRLWPLIIITTGLSILSLKHIIWRIASIILLLLTMLGIALVVTGNLPNTNPMSTQEQIIDKISNNIKQAEISVKAGASSINIGTQKQSSIMKVRLESNVAVFTNDSIMDGTTQKVSLTMDTSLSNRWLIGDARSLWNIDLSRDLPLQLNIDSGATDTNIDMTEAHLRTINLKTGASSLNLKVGVLEDAVDVNIESGVSTIVLQIPTSSGVKLSLDSGLTSKNLADLVEGGDRMYESPGYDQSNKKVNIISKVGLSSFTIERY